MSSDIPIEIANIIKESVAAEMQHEWSDARNGQKKAVEEALTKIAGEKLLALVAKDDKEKTRHMHNAMLYEAGIECIQSTRKIKLYSSLANIIGTSLVKIFKAGLIAL